MRMTFLAFALLLSLLLDFGSAERAAAEEFAPIAPLAPRSLLIDITTAGERVVIAGERGHILYSDDDGKSWQQARVPTTQMLTAVHFVDQLRGWAVGHDGLILVSEDGGEVWRVQRDGLAAQQQFNIEAREQTHRRVKDLQQALDNAGDEALPDLEMQMEEAALDLEDAELALEEAVFTSPLMDVWFQDSQRGWSVGTFGTLVTTEDGGQHWASHPGLLDNPYDFHLNCITGDGTGRLFIAGEGGLMFRSLDGGQQWEAVEPFYEGSWFGLAYIADHDTLLAFGLRGNLYRSPDFGDSWELVPNDNHLTLAGGSVSPDGEVLLVGGVGTLLHSVDGGQSFQRSMVADGLSLSSGLIRDQQWLLVGQGGVRTYRGGDSHE